MRWYDDYDDDYWDDDYDPFDPPPPRVRVVPVKVALKHAQQSTTPTLDVSTARRAEAALLERAKRYEITPLPSGVEYAGAERRRMFYAQMFVLRGTYYKRVPINE